MNSDLLTLLRNVLETHIPPTQRRTRNEFSVASQLRVWTLKSDCWIQIPALPLTSYMTLNKEVTCPSIPKERGFPFP